MVLMVNEIYREGNLKEIEDARLSKLGLETTHTSRNRRLVR